MLFSFKKLFFTFTFNSCLFLLLIIGIQNSSIKSKVNLDLDSFFDQYLYNSKIPIFEYKIHKEGREYVLVYRWDAIENFNMKLFINNGQNNTWIYPESKWKEFSLGNIDIKSFKIRDDLFYIDVKKIN